jgi:hypothetical protein
MTTKLSASSKSFIKYVFWTAIAAVLVEVGNAIPNWNIPDVYVPIIGAVLKAGATYVATKKNEWGR